jgi:glutamate/tyrosine decarboxylase-like PLP-dependent enzyme
MSRSLPEKELSKEELLQEMQALRSDDVDWRSGRAWSLMYYVDDDHQEKIEAAYQQFFSENFVSPVTFASLQRLEREVVDWSAGMLNAPEGYAGLLTSGGSESIFLVVWAARETARSRGIRKPEIVLPATGHPAFRKAAAILDMRVRTLTVDKDQTAVPVQLSGLLSRKTVLVVGSAPSYPHGVLDPIREMAELAQNKGIPFHVDACVGGFMLPWVEALGHTLEPWDFRVPGVTSISADVHKFGYGAKGCSLLLHRNDRLLKQHLYVQADWPGGIYATAGLAGTRPGGAIAAAWASLRGLGRSGFLATAETNLKAASHLRSQLEAIPELEIIGKPCMNIMAYRTRGNVPDLFILADFLEERGWQVDRQHKPLCLHLTVMKHHVPVIEDYVRDVREGLAFAKNQPERSEQGTAALYGLMARLPTGGMVRQQVRQLVRSWYVKGEGSRERAIPEIPSWQGQLNRWLLRFNRWRQKR